MRRFILRYNIIIILIFSSCYFYSPVRFSKRIILYDNAVNKNGEKSKEENVTSGYGVIKEDNRILKTIKDERIYKIYLKRFFAGSTHSSPVAMINNKGVDYAIKGRFKEAEILFKESISEVKDFPPAYNNLGIIFELFGYRKKAFNMYSRACILEPDNEYFRKNFLSFNDYNRK